MDVGVLEKHGFMLEVDMEPLLSEFVLRAPEHELFDGLINSKL